VGFESGEESGAPYPYRLQVHWPRNECNSPVVQGKKVIQSFVNPLGIIDTNVRAVSAVGASVHKTVGMFLRVSSVTSTGRPQKS